MSVTLSTLTTLRVGGPADRLVTVDDESALVDCVRGLDADGTPVLVMGGGSNVVIADEGLRGTVVHVDTRGIRLEEDGCGGAWVAVAAGEDWDEFVARAVDEEWSGLESMSGIPGRVGATPIQNVGAYGGEVAETIARVRLWDRQSGRIEMWPAGDCGFGYRSSRFKRNPDRYVVLEVSFQLRRGNLSAPLRYRELVELLGAKVGERVPMAEVRAGVLHLRRAKGMVLDAADHDTWSVGSFFVNPVVSVERAADLPAAAPRYPQPDGQVKTSAAWLVEHAGFPRGWRPDPAFPAGLSTRHALAITNRGGASAADVLAVAGAVRSGVLAAFGIALEPEPRLIGCALPG